MIAAGSGKWHTQSGQFLQLVVVFITVKDLYTVFVYGRIQADGRINDTVASLRIYKVGMGIAEHLTKATCTQ